MKTNYECDSPRPPSPSSERTPQTLRLVIPVRLPSWNAVLGMGHWQRAKLKSDFQLAFLSALQATDADSWTKITFVKSTPSIAAATLASYRETQQQKRKLRSAKKRLEAKTKNAPSLK